MTRRLVSFVGTGNYEVTEYAWHAFGSCRTRYVAEALGRLAKVDEALLLATHRAWQKHGAGLVQAFDQAAIPVRRVAIPDGSTDDELWEQFRMLRDVCGMSAEDTLFVDITHGFRAQPFFAGSVLSVLHAAGKEQPQTRLLYGEFRKGERESPIWDLTLFLELVDWARALSLFLRTGVAAPVVELARRQDERLRSEQLAKGGKDWPRFGALAKALEDFSNDLAAVRVASLVTGYEQDDARKAKARGTAARLAEAVRKTRDEVERRLPALAGILDRIVAMAEPLAADRLASTQGQHALAALARQYLEFGRVPEAAVLVREAAVCRHARGEVAAVEVNNRSFSDAERLRVDREWSRIDPQAGHIAELRNDIEHAGFRKQPLSARVLKERIVPLVEALVTTSAEAPLPEPHGRTYFVSRHPGALDWLVEEGIDVDERVEHLDVERIEPGDTVVGTLPVQLIALLCSRGARYLHLSLDLPAGLRGRELTAKDLRACNARLEEFTARRVEGAR